MPTHFFPKAVAISYETAERADTSKQDFSVCPRHWYIDAYFVCQMCEQQFLWSRSEQRYWFEELRLWIDSHPFLCRECRARKRDITAVRRSYDAGIGSALSSGTVMEKEALRQVLQEFEVLAGVLPPRMAENLALLERQIQNLHHRQE